MLVASSLSMTSSFFFAASSLAASWRFRRSLRSAFFFSSSGLSGFESRSGASEDRLCLRDPSTGGSANMSREADGLDFSGLSAAFRARKACSWDRDGRCPLDCLGGTFSEVVREYGGGPITPELPVFDCDRLGSWRRCELEAEGLSSRDNSFFIMNVSKGVPTTKESRRLLGECQR